MYSYTQAQSPTHTHINKHACIPPSRAPLCRDILNMGHIYGTPHARTQGTHAPDARGATSPTALQTFLAHPKPYSRISNLTHTRVSQRQNTAHRTSLFEHVLELWSDLPDAHLESHWNHIDNTSVTGNTQVTGGQCPRFDRSRKSDQGDGKAIP